MSASDTGLAYVQLASNIDDGGADVGGIQTILSFEIDGMGSLIVAINVVENFGTLSAFDNSMQVVLAAPQTTVLLAGAEFVLDCQVDRGAETATGSIEIAGFAEVAVGPMPFLIVGPSDPMVGAGMQLVELAQVVEGTVVEVDFENFRISSASPLPIPALYPLPLILLTVVLLSGGALQIRSGTIRRL